VSNAYTNLYKQSLSLECCKFANTNSGVFVRDSVVQKKGVKTIPLQITSTEGATEQDEAEESISEAYSGISGRDEGEALPGQLLHQDASSIPRIYEQEYRWDAGDMADNFPQNVEVISELVPSKLVYVGGTTIPLSSYQTAFGKYIWIERSGLRQYLSIPQYSSLPLMAYTSAGGPGEIIEMFSTASNQGTYLKTYYNFNLGYNRIHYRGDVAGRHYLLCAQNDAPSNAIYHRCEQWYDWRLVHVGNYARLRDIDLVVLLDMSLILLAR
jgi:hypothetical protein